MRYIIIYIFFLNFCSGYAVSNFTLSMAQSYNSDFFSGERSSFDVSFLSDTKFQDSIFVFCCTYNLRFALGVRYEQSSKMVDSHIIPTDNELFGETVIKYPVGWMVDPFVSSNFRTQLTEVIAVFNNTKMVSANFWDPVNIQETLGLTYSLKDSLIKNDIRIGVSLMQVRSKNFTATTDDPMTYDVKERYKTKVGIDLVNSLMYQIDKSTSLNSKVSMFGDYDNLEVWTVRFENDINIMIWKMIGLICKLNVFYDQTQMLKVQVQQSLRIGLITAF